MIQDASPVRDGIPDGYIAHYKIDIGAAQAGTLDTRRLPPGFTAVYSGSNGIYNIGFPAASFLAVRSPGANVDVQSTTNTNQINAMVVNINLTAGTAQVVCLTNAGAAASLSSGAVLYAHLEFEAL